MSPTAIVEEIEIPFHINTDAPPSPTHSTSSSSSGSYDLEDAAPDTQCPEIYPTAPLSGHTSEVEIDQNVND